MRTMQEAEKDERHKSGAIFVVIFLFLEILKVIENRVRYIFTADGSYCNSVWLLTKYQGVRTLFLTARFLVP